MFCKKAYKILQKLIPNPAHLLNTNTRIFSLQKSYKNLALDLAFRFAEKTWIISKGPLNVFMRLKGFDCKYLTISVALSIKSTKIMILRILETVLALSTTNTRSLTPVFLISATIYMRFGMSKGCLYMRDSAGSFSNTCIYLTTFGIMIEESISIRTSGKTFLRWQAFKTSL